MSDTATRARAVPHPLLVFLAILIAVLAGLSLAVRRIPIDGFRGRIEAAFDRATGRTLHIDGPLRLTLLPVPGLVADDVSVANLPGASPPVMAQVRRLSAHVALAPLLAGNVRVVGLTLTDPDIVLERLPDGTANWRFTPVRKPGGVKGGGATTAHRFRFTVDTVDGTGGTLRWNDRSGAGTGAVSLATFHAGAADRDRPFTLYVSGRHGTAPFALSLASGSLASLPLGGPAEEAAFPDAGFPVRANLALGSGDRTARLALDGRFADPLRLHGFVGNIHATVPMLAALNAVLPKAALPDAIDVALDARFGLDARGHEIVERIAFSGAATDLGRWRTGLRLARFAIGASAPDSPVSIEAAGAVGTDRFDLSIPAVGTLALWQFGATGTGPLSVAASSGSDRLSLSGTVTRAAGAGVVGAIDAGRTVLAIADPDRLDRLSGRHLGWRRPMSFAGGLSVRRAADGDLAAGLDASSWSLDGDTMPPLHVSAERDAASVVTVRATLPDRPAQPIAVWSEDLSRHPSPVSLTVDGQGLPASALLVALFGRSGLDGRLDMTAHLDATADGATLDPATLSGPVDATLENATVDAALVRLWLGPVLDAAHLPSVPVGRQSVRCAGLRGRFENGVLQADSLSLDDPSIVLNGSGVIDLAARTLSLSLRPTLRMGAIGASAPVTLAGPFGAPHATLAPNAAGRFTLSIGEVGDGAAAACDAAADLGPAPRQAKRPRALDILRGLGLFK